MKIGTRVLSLVLAGSMALSVTPVSAFAATPVLGGGTVSPTALSETNSTDDVYDSRVDGSHELRCTGGIFNGTIKDAIYVVNQNSAPAAKLNFTPPDGHSIVAWRVDMGTKWGYSDATDEKVQMLLKAAGLQCSADNTELTFSCPGSITYKDTDGKDVTSPAFVADASLTPVLDITADDLRFEKGTVVLGTELSSGSGITVTPVYYSVTDGVKDSEAMESRPTKPGQYQIAVKLSVDGASATDKYLNRVKCGDVYYQVEPSQELTSDAWRYQVVSKSVDLKVDENGEPVVPSGTSGADYANGVLTIYPNFVVHFGEDDVVKCAIVNNGTLDGGIFTGTVTNNSVIESGMFVNKPEKANSVKFSFTSGATFCGLKDSSGITSLYIVRTDAGRSPHISASYSNASRKSLGWMLAMTAPSFNGTDYGLMSADWTLDSTVSTAVPEALYDAVAIYTPVAYMDSSDLSIDSTGKVESSIPEVEATGVTYTNTVTGESFDSYPTAAGSYVAHVSLKCTRDWDSIANQDPITPVSALLADGGIAVQSDEDEQENLIYRVALKGDLYYFVPETLDLAFTVEKEPVQPELSIVDGLPDTTGMEADADGVYTSKNWTYNEKTGTLSVTNSSYFETFTGTVNCKVIAGEGVNIGSGYFMDTVTFDGGTVSGGWFVKEPEGCAPSAVHSITYADGSTEFTVNDTLTVTKIWFGGPLNIKISTKTPIYSVSDKYLPRQTTSLTYTYQYPSNYVLNSLPEPVLSTLTLNGVTDAYVMLDTTYRLNMTDPQELREGVKVTVKADACDADHQVEWVATGLDLSDEQKHSAELTFTMPGHDVTLTATYPLIQPVPPTDDTGNVQIPEGETEVKGDGWTAKKDETTGKTTVEITGDKDFNDAILNCDEITIGSAEKSTTVSNITTNANVTVASGSTIESGTFTGNVSGEGTISGGTFTGDIGDDVTITGGVFAGNIPATVESTKVTATGGASINNIKNDGNSEDNETTVQVVGEPTLALAYTPDAGRTFYGWQKDKTEMIVKGEESTNTNVKVDSTDSDPVYTPVVKLIKADLEVFDLTEVAETEGYYQVIDGELTGDCLGNELPTAPGTYALGVKLAKKTAEPTENSIALYADDAASVGGSVLMKEGVGYYVPEVLAIGDAETVIDPDAGSGDSGAGGAAVAVIGGAAIGGAAYLIGTQVYLTNVLPEGAAIPTNRQQLADLLWTAAGKPQPASTALFTDISAEAADSQKAARWCVEQGLLKDTGSTFKPGEYTFRPQVIKAWNDLQAKLNNQK